MSVFPLIQLDFSVGWQQLRDVFKAAGKWRVQHYARIFVCWCLVHDGVFREETAKDLWLGGRGDFVFLPS